MKHLYRDGAERAEVRKFEQLYGSHRGRRIYGAVVGTVRAERKAARTRRRR